MGGFSAGEEAVVMSRTSTTELIGPRLEATQEAFPFASVQRLHIWRGASGRRYVHLRIDVASIARLSQAAPFAWSSYRFAEREGEFEYTQVVTSAPGTDAAPPTRDLGRAAWTGLERVAFRLHVPSKVTFHNSPSRTIERGNIIVWEQLLTDRVKGEPVEIQVRMETASILYRTLALFIAMMVAVGLTFAGAIWFVKTRKA